MSAYLRRLSSGSQYVGMVQPLSLIALVVEVNRANTRKKFSRVIELNRLSRMYKHGEIHIEIEYDRFATRRSKSTSIENCIIPLVKVQEASVRGGTRRTRSASGAAAAASISRRADAPPVVTLRVGYANVHNWSVKAIRRKTTGTGRMRYLRHLPRRFKSNFREGTQATPRIKGVAASS
ncbi:hypothetical protein Sjap_011429 [Stephania japonica]|uniref:Uncharacterized protein n=1 Tax=Stephania japonica TaxID=461633 RepID=A0AAP0P4Q0_9MAGN